MNWKSTLDPLYIFWKEVRRPRRSEYGGVDADGYYFVWDELGQNQVFVSHPRRLDYYSKGVAHRLRELATEYCVDDLKLGPEDQVIDVGAHSGEFGLWFKSFGIQYLGIEPDPVSFGALSRNHPESHLRQVALGEKPGTAEFFLATSTADSSFGHVSDNSVVVSVDILDNISHSVFPSGEIALLKIEAEGYEPEVLAGATDTLARTRIVAVDAGEERAGESTAPECITRLHDFGFVLKKVFLRRGVFYFENPALISQK